MLAQFYFLYTLAKWRKKKEEMRLEGSNSETFKFLKAISLYVYM